MPESSNQRLVTQIRSCHSAYYVDLILSVRDLTDDFDLITRTSMWRSNRGRIFTIWRPPAHPHPHTNQARWCHGFAVECHYRCHPHLTPLHNYWYGCMQMTRRTWRVDLWYPYWNWWQWRCCPRRAATWRWAPPPVANCGHTVSPLR